MTRSRTVVVLLVSAVLAAVVAAASAEDTKPSILTPAANTPLGSFKGADGPVADDALEDEDAEPVGAPIGTTMTEPKPELAANAPPGATEATSTAGATTAISETAVAVLVGAVAAVFAF